MCGFFQNIRYISVLFIACFICVACEDVDVQSNKPIPFDKVKWKRKVGSDYPHRDHMLDDLLFNDIIRAYNKEEILDLLGEPSYSRDDEDFLHYTITQKRLGLWVLHSKTMVVKFSEDDNIDWIKIHE